MSRTTRDGRRHYRLAWALTTLLAALAGGSSATAEPGATTPVRGFADLHAHVFGEAAFGGRWHWGTVEGREEVALPRCDGDFRTHAGAGGRLFSSRVGAIPGITDGDTGNHGSDEMRDGYPSYTGWPRWDTVAHVQYWEGHLEQALADGLKLMLVQAVDNVAFCQLAEKAVTSPASAKQYACDLDDSYDSLVRQVRLAKAFAERSSKIEIAYTPREARDIIARGQMAWVLGIEADYMWASERKRIDLRDRLQRYHQEGVRAMYLAHQVNTKLAGAAVYFEPIKTLQWIANCFYLDEGCNSPEPRGQRPSNQIRITNFLCGGWWGLFPRWGAHYGEICDFAYAGWIAEGKNGFADYPGGGVVPPGEGGSVIERNRMGLTEDGATIVEAMMDLGVLIDIGHASENAVEGVMSISAGRDDYPVFASHAYFRDRLLPADDDLGQHFYNQSHELPLSARTVDYIERTGGIAGYFVGPDPHGPYEGSGVENDCAGSSRSLAQGLAWGVDRGVNLAIATDFMGMGQGVAPRKGGHGQCLGVEKDQEAQRDTPGSGSEAFDTRGLAHIGLVGALMADLEAVGLSEEHLGPVRDGSAEAFIRMWERAESRKTR